MQKFFAILAILFVNGAMSLPTRRAFITDPCTSDADCDSGCCGFKSGKCAGAVVALERDNGCGFGDAQSNNNAAVALGFTGQFTPTPASGGAAAGANNGAATENPTTVDGTANNGNGNGNGNGNTGSGKPPGQQFITGVCGADTDCASGCCGFKSGKCAGAVVALERDNGCGFGDAQSNNNAAVALGFTGQFTPTPASGGAAAGANNGAATDNPTTVDDGTANNGNGNGNGNGNTGSGKPPGQQFITGVCGADTDCASGCCGFKSGKCAGAVVALERDNGCGFGEAQSNNNAAIALGFTGQFTPTQARK